MGLKGRIRALALAVVGIPVLLITAIVGAFYIGSSNFAPNVVTGAIHYAGKSREYLLHVPPTYSATRPTALVISLHPAAMWPNAQATLTRWNDLADREGFIVVYPAGTALSGAASGVLPFRVWLLRPEATVADNVEYISSLIDSVSARYAIDAQRVYVNGFSNGGAMAFALSCRLSDRLAAVGTVSAAQDQPWSWCADSTPVPFINFHGTADLVPYQGGRKWSSPRPFPSVEDWTANWAHRNRCAESPVVDTVAADVVRRSYQGCASDASVVLYTVTGGGHAWPGGKPLPEWVIGRTTHSVDATALMWSFFRAHPRPQR